MLEIKVKYHSDITPLSWSDIGDWIDLRVAEDVTLDAGEFKLIPLGVSMKLPRGFEAHIVPRSSTFKYWGLIQTNHMGVIDESYCGDGDQWMFPALATKNVIIPKDTRLCQFRIMPKMGYVFFEEVDHLDDPDRGGFGSSGRN